jgi:hypothetical protein
MCRWKRHTAGPAAPDLDQVVLDLVRQREALRVVQRDLGDRDAGGLEQRDLPLEEREPVARAEASHEVRAPRRPDADARLGDARGLRGRDLGGPPGHHLLDRAVDVAALVDVADVDEQRERLGLERERRRILRGTLARLLVVQVREVGDARLGMERAQQLLEVRHLRDELRAHERAEREALEPRLRQRVEQLDLGSERDGDVLDAEALAHHLLVVDDLRPAAHRVLRTASPCVQLYNYYTFPALRQDGAARGSR